MTKAFGKRRWRNIFLIILGVLFISFIGSANTPKPAQTNQNQIYSEEEIAPLEDAESLQQSKKDAKELSEQKEEQDKELTDKQESAVKTYLVTRVIDGDTIQIETGQTVRYIGIDTPETLDPRKSVQCFGVEASNKNKEFVEGKRVRLEADVTNTDKYGRLLRYIYVDDTFINLELVSFGFAHSYSYPPDIKYQDKIIEAQENAQENKRGLWGACPPEEITPPKTSGSYIYSGPQTASEPENNTCTIKGNISSSGEKIYHKEGCGSYNLTKIDLSRGEKWFCTDEEALKAGWRKALNC